MKSLKLKVVLEHGMLHLRLLTWLGMKFVFMLLPACVCQLFGLWCCVSDLCDDRCTIAKFVVSEFCVHQTFYNLSNRGNCYVWN
jgi:hypothetical protein